MDTSWLEVLGFVTGVICVLLAARAIAAIFAVGIVNSLVFLVLFWQTGIYANAGLQLVFLALAIHGWALWRRGRGGEPLQVRPTPRAVWWIGPLIALAAAAAIYALLRATSASQQPEWDAVTTAASLLAQVMLNRKWRGTWLVWIVTDVALVGLYASLGLWLTAALYAVFTAIAVSGWVHWSRVMRTGPLSQQAVGVPA